MWRDLRHGLRLFTTRPTFAFLLVLTFAIAIGAATTIFSVAYPVLLQPLPYDHPEQLISIADNAQGRPLDVTFGTFLEIASRSHSFENISVFRSWQPAFAGTEHTQRVDSQRVSADYFGVLRARPALGRIFSSDADRPNGPKQVVISHATWQSVFAGDVHVIGREMKLDGVAYEIVGVMPQTFENVMLPSAQVWAPLQYDPTLSGGFDTREWGHHLRMIGRLRSGVTIDAARQELSIIARTPMTEFARPMWASMTGGMLASRMRDHLTREAKPGLIAVSIAVALLLLIASVNIANLLLARAAQRRTEFAVRTALGASRSNLLRHVFAETCVLAGAGCILANMLAVAALGGSSHLLPADLPRRAAVRLDLRVLLFSLALTLCVTAAVAIAPAFYSLRRGVSAALKSGAGTIARGQDRVRQTLIVMQFALAVTLLVLSGLLIHSTHRLFSVPTGFATEGTLTMQVQDGAPRPGAYAMEMRGRSFEQSLAAARSQPGVLSAGLTSQLPLSGQVDQYGVSFDDAPPTSAQSAYRYAITPGYLETLRVPLIRGRMIDDHDLVSSQPVALISASLAARQFPNVDPIGHRLIKAPLAFTIVGVVGDVKQESLAAADADAFYVPLTQWSFIDPALSLVVRTADHRSDLATETPKAIWKANPDQAITKVATMSSLVATSEERRLFVGQVFNAFAGIALLLAAIGIYGVLSGGVVERMREIGVRLTFGATPNEILALILRQGAVLVVLGALAGFVAAAVASRILGSLLYGTSRFDPLTYLLVTVTVAAVSFVACGVPARRAANLDPAVILRNE